MSGVDKVLQFHCDLDDLVGILSLPLTEATRGVLIVVGGPQYRAGSHRQFTLLARDLSASGVAAMRFDYRGMGDSEGDVRSFEEVDNDLRAAVDAFFTAVPTLKSVVLWGLCDGACAALFYAPHDARVSGVVLLNPWVHTEVGAARTRLKHYYLRRFMERTFWQKLLRGKFDPITAVRSLTETLKRSRATSPALDKPADAANQPTLPDRMRESFHQFQGNILLILSGRDLTAKQFLDTATSSKEWRKILRSPRIQRHDLAEADHTFSQRVWRNRVSAWTVDWLSSKIK